MAASHFSGRTQPPVSKLRRSRADALRHQAVFAPDAQMQANLAEAAALDAVKTANKHLKNRTAKRRGVAVEGTYGNKGAMAVLDQEGYRPERRPRSEGPWDVSGDKKTDATPGPLRRLVQCKRVAVFSPTALNGACHLFLGIYTHENKGVPVASGIRREAWLWQDRHGWVARIFIEADGTLSADGPKGAVVLAAVQKSVTAWKPGRSKKRTGPCFDCRIVNRPCIH